MHPTNINRIGQETDLEEGPKEGSKRGPKAPLDIIANFASPCSNQADTTGSGEEAIQAYFDAVFRGYRLHNHVRNIWFTKDARRVRACHYNIQSSREEDVVEVYRDTVNSRAVYQRLQTCASVWSCPICAPKIAKRRSLEMRKITDWARGEGLRVLMMTLTSRHEGEDKLRWLLALQKVALDQLRDGKRTLKKILPYRHFVRAREVTYGRSGWHPHYHELLFTEDQRSVPELVPPVFKLWSNLSVNAGLEFPDQKAFHLTDCNEVIADYISKFGHAPKWTEAEEVTLGFRKSARHVSLTPWGLLDASYGGDHRAGELWCEYSEAVKQLNQLRCSPGLKAAAGLDDKTDLEVVTEEGETVREWFANIPTSVWECVRQKWRAQLLQVAATGSREGFTDLLTHAVVDHHHKRC